MTGAGSAAGAAAGAGTAFTRASLRQRRVVEPGVVAVERLLGPVARAHQRSGHALQEAARQGAAAR